MKKNFEVTVDINVEMIPTDLLFAAAIHRIKEVKKSRQKGKYNTWMKKLLEVL